jgi:hypothetical protein
LGRIDLGWCGSLTAPLSNDFTSGPHPNFTTTTMSTTSGQASTQEDHRTLVCGKCWEQLFDHGQVWTRETRRSRVALHTTAEELLSATQPPTKCNCCQLLLRSTQSFFPRAFTAGPSTPLVFRFSGGEYQGFEVFGLEVSALCTNYIMDRFVLNSVEGGTPNWILFLLCWCLN